MTTTHRQPTVPGEPNSMERLLLVLAALVVLVAVGCITLGPPGAVADARRAVAAMVEGLAGLSPGTMPRAQVESVANVLLFVPLGALAARALRRRTTVLPLALGAGTSVLVELTQAALPGRVPDLVDVAANTVGTALGVALTTVLLASSQRPTPRRNAVPRSRRGALTALVSAPLVLAGVTGCSTAGSVASSVGSTEAPVAAEVPAGAALDGAALTAQDGWLPDGDVLSPFDDAPALTRLDDSLRTAVQDAFRDAKADEVGFHVTTGWRSASYQKSLFDDAVAKYGSPEAARAWVLPPDESSHVTGDAVDVGPTEAMYWLAQHGSDYGLCQTYANEMWHFELAVERGGECPAPVDAPAAR
ncbi:VanZ family protein [Pengzhenrongella sicca]|uniref:VanZ family protein n=1 Tax=Pengzhenrongella sicca TaxID=2819238 RepID=A0A8A4ZKP0_9MICO|nr:VanZ family protein [Pengzhenrongella sicca]QTE31087.1 VanZ family protein [Pengzhenrongella sicca]